MTAAAKGLSAKITNTIATLVLVRATTMLIEERQKAPATAQPGRPILTTARSGFDRSRQMINSDKLTQADNERQNTVCHA